MIVQLYPRFVLDGWVAHDPDVAEFDHVGVVHTGLDDVEGVDRCERSVDVALAGVVGIGVELVPVLGEAGSGVVEVLGYDLDIDAADDVGESVLGPVVQDRVDPGGVVHDSLVEPGNSSIEAVGCDVGSGVATGPALSVGVDCPPAQVVVGHVGDEGVDDLISNGGHVGIDDAWGDARPAAQGAACGWRRSVLSGPASAEVSTGWSGAGSGEGRGVGDDTKGRTIVASADPVS